MLLKPLNYMKKFRKVGEQRQLMLRKGQRTGFWNHQFQRVGKSGQPFYRLSPFLAAIVKEIILLQTTPYFFVHTCVLPTANTNV